MNFLDKAIGVISPQVALRRTVARRKLNIINTGYSHHGASRSKKSMRGWDSSGGSTEEDIDNNLELLRERSRDLYMGAPIATGALKTLRTNVVGAGLRLKSQIDYKYLGLTEDGAYELEEQIEREFNLWSESLNCDAQRMNDFYELQQLAFLSQLMNGECFALLPQIKRKDMPYDLRVMLIEADRICDPRIKNPDKIIINGVEVGEFGEVLAYYILNKHPLEKCYGKKEEWKKIDKFGKKSGRANILHMMEIERVGQRRGVPILSPVVECLKQLSRYTEAELMSAVVSGMFTVFIENPNETDSREPMLGAMIDDSDSVLDEEEQDINYELAPGAIVELGEGQKANSINPGRPNPEFNDFVTSICRQIGVAIELPYELLIKHFTSSYSASRAALLEAWKMFRMRRTWLAKDFCQPVYEEWLCEAVAKGRINAPGFFTDPMVRKAYSNAQWNGPSQGQIDPLKEVKAAKERVDGGFSTRTKETMELTGEDFSKNVRQLRRERELMEKGGVIEDEVLENKEFSR